MRKNEQGQSVRDQIIVLKNERKMWQEKLSNLDSHGTPENEIKQQIQAINACIERLKLHLGKTDQRIERLKVKEKECESAGNDELASLLHLQKYILRLGKHIDHLIESVESTDIDRADMHFHRLDSRINNIRELTDKYDEMYRK